LKELSRRLIAIAVLALLVPSGHLFAADGETDPEVTERVAAPAWIHPESAVPGSTPERTDALRQLTPEQEKEFLERRIDEAEQFAAAKGAELQAKPATRWVRSDLFGSEVRSATAGAESSVIVTPGLSLSKPVKQPPFGSLDADFDSLPDSFETAVSDGFTPAYYISGGEKAGTGFARFGNYTPQTVIQNLPAVPPASHYRVTPVGFTNGTNGQQYGFLQIDYLSLWNKDDGLSISNSCRTYATVLGGLIGYGLSGALNGLGGHVIDNERSAVLVAAPTTASFQYSTNINAYQGYDFYIAAHENTFFDHSTYLSPSQPVPVNNHLLLAMSKAKHGTYAFNPDGFPLFPGWIINTTYYTLDFLYYNYYIDYYSYLVYLGMADTLYFSCVVERFQDLGGRYSSPRINVGELGHTLNSSGFIADPRVQSKLTPLLWYVQ